MKEAGITLGVFCLLAVSVAVIMHREDEKNKAFLRVTEEQRILADREIYDYTPSTDGTVSYTYYAEELPEKLHEREIVTRRTEVADHYVVRDIDERTREVRATFHLNPVRAIDDKGVWRELKNATTTESAWNLRPLTLAQKIEDVVMPVAHADFILAAGAGEVRRQTSGSCSFAPVRSAAAGTAIGTGLVGVELINGAVGGTSDCEPSVFRSFLPFDTSSIPSGFPITSASIPIGYSEMYDDEGGAVVALLTTTSQTTHTALALADFSKIATTTQVNTGATDLTLSFTPPPGGTHTYDIAAGSLSVIKRSGEASTCSATNGITCLGMYVNVGAGGESASNLGDSTDNNRWLALVFASTTLTSNYTDVTFVPWQFQDF
jgi:hypothetical protein